MTTGKEMVKRMSVISTAATERHEPWLGGLMLAPNEAVEHNSFLLRASGSPVLVQRNWF